VPLEHDAIIRQVELAERRAKRIISRRWGAVLKLALALLRRQSHRLTGREARRLVGPLS
jgi:hypothetical protein